MNPVILIGILGGAAALLFLSKKSEAAPVVPTPTVPPTTPKVPTVVKPVPTVVKPVPTKPISSGYDECEFVLGSLKADDQYEWALTHTSVACLLKIADALAAAGDLRSADVQIRALTLKAKGYS